MKLMVIDDDIQIREGIRDSIDWKDLEIEEVRSYGNALSALEDIEEFSPEIILSDVRMPGMDGLQFLAQIKAVNQDIKVIMISAHSDFEYLKKAIKHGAQDYELKPLKMRKLNSIIRKTVKLVKQERQLADKSDMYFQQYKIDFIRKILSGGISIGSRTLNDLVQYFDLTGIEQMQCLTLQLDYPQHELNHDTFLWLENNVHKKNSEKIHYMVTLEQENRIILIVSPENSETHTIDLLIKEFVSALNREIPFLKQSISGGISEEYPLNEISQAYDESCLVLQHASYRGPGSLIKKESLKNLSVPDENEIIQLQEYVIDSFINHDLNRMNECIKSIEKWFYSNQVYEQKLYRKSMLNCQIQIMNRMRHHNLFNIEDFSRSSKNHFFLFDFTAYWVKIFSTSLDTLIEHKQRHLSSMTIKALEYIKVHYKEQISAVTVADYIEKSPNYFSSVFKKELSVSFKEMLNQLRINEAERLIKEESLYIYEVADKVGFKDYAYFYQVFKKLKGYEPSGIRKN